jgi:hypothetical protein
MYVGKLSDLRTVEDSDVRTFDETGFFFTWRTGFVKKNRERRPEGSGSRSFFGLGSCS